MSYTVRSHGVIAGREYSSSQPLRMITEYRLLKKIPKHYEVIDTTTDIGGYVQPYTKTVKRNSESRIFLQELVKNIQAGGIVRVGAHVFIFKQDYGLYEIYRKVKMV